MLKKLINKLKSFFEKKQANKDVNQQEWVDRSKTLNGWAEKH
jgi:hypothetical protein